MTINDSLLEKMKDHSKIYLEEPKIYFFIPTDETLKSM